jgi:hypothetical protein
MAVMTFGGFCWYCFWGWPKPVTDIYEEAVKALDGYEPALQHGPAHIVWSDENFEDEHIRWCLKELADPDKRAFYDLDDQSIAVVRQSLEKLLAVPESVRCCEPEDYDGEHPDKYPPPAGMKMVKKW